MPFAFENTTDEVLAGVDLTGKVAVVTGATSGIGVETARALAAKGALVVITARDQAKADESLKALREALPSGKFESALMDLGSLKTVRAAAADLIKRFPKIDIVINNAGVMNTPFGRTEDGFETQFGVDHLGHFVFTNELAPALVAAAPSRVVCLSSAAHLRGDIQWDDVNWDTQPYDKFRAYAQAKTANMLYALALDKRLSGKGVRAFGVHPGVISTGLGRYMTPEDMAAMRGRSSAQTTEKPADKPAAEKPAGDKPANPMAGLRFKSIPQGAASSVWAATASELDGKGGLYIEDGHLAEPHAPGVMGGVQPYAVDPASAERLWEISEKMVGKTYAL